MQCKRCQSEHAVKNGKRAGKQYYLCRGCNHQFVLEKELRSKEEKQLAVMLYCLGLSLSEIGDMLNVHPSTIMRWIKKHGYKKDYNESHNKAKPSGTITIELDEMQHYIMTKKINAEFRRFIEENAKGS